MITAPDRSFRVDRSSFLLLTAALAACAGAEAPRAEPAPIAPPPPATDATPPASAVPSAPSSSAVAAPVPDAEAPAAPDPVADAVVAYGSSLRQTRRCDEWTYDPKPRGAEGMPKHYSDLSLRCGPLESFNIPSPCSEGAFGCQIVVNALTDAAARRVLGCLRAKKGVEICADPGNGSRVGVVQGCAEKAFVATPPRHDTEAVCRAISGACSTRPGAVSIDACERFASSIRMCDSAIAGLDCLRDKCSVRACLDDFVQSYSF
jgi:hypothetical protein